MNRAWPVATVLLASSLGSCGMNQGGSAPPPGGAQLPAGNVPPGQQSADQVRLQLLAFADLSMGEMERLGALGLFEPPTLAMLEEAMMRIVESKEGVVLADLWDVEKLSACPSCQAERMSNLRDMNRHGTVNMRVDCPQCREHNGEQA